jgi:hypothetical protein
MKKFNKKNEPIMMKATKNKALAGIFSSFGPLPVSVTSVA